MPDTHEGLDYVAVRPCGCWVMWHADPGIDPDELRWVAREVARCVKLGYTVRRMTTDEVRALPHACPVCHPPSPQMALEVA